MYRDYLQVDSKRKNIKSCYLCMLSTFVKQCQSCNISGEDDTNSKLLTDPQIGVVLTVAVEGAGDRDEEFVQHIIQ